VGQNPVAPCAGILQYPVAVLLLAREQVGIQPESGGNQVHGVVTYDISRLRVACKPVRFTLYRQASPIHLGRGGELRPPAPVVKASDDTVLRIVVLRFGIITIVEPGKACYPVTILRIVRFTQPIEVESREALARVFPIE